MQCHKCLHYVYNIVITHLSKHPTQGRFTLWTMKSHYGRWHFSMVKVHGPTSMVRLLKKIVLQDLGPSLGVNRMWIKKNDHASTSECVAFIQYMLKKGNFEKKKNSSSTVLLFFLGFHLSFISSLMCRRCGLQIFSQQFVQKLIKEFIYTWSM